MGPWSFFRISKCPVWRFLALHLRFTSLLQIHLSAVATFWPMSLVGMYPGKASTIASSANCRRKEALEGYFKGDKRRAGVGLLELLYKLNKCDQLSIFLFKNELIVCNFVFSRALNSFTTPSKQTWAFRL